MTSLDIRSARAATLAVTATLALLTLAACGGGGGGGTASNGGPYSPTLTDARSANGSAARNAGAQAATNLPSFGSVTQSTNAGSVAGISGDAASTSFDGRNVRVTVQRTDGSQLAFDGATDRIGGESYPPVLPGYSYRGDALLTSTATTLSVAAVYTNWNNADPTDYLAGGYWMHLEGRTDTLEITGADIGAFVDGPELSGVAPTLPRLGTARYLGRAGGVYAYEAGRSTEVGEFDTDAQLTANFTSNTISGCLGCVEGVTIWGVATDANGNASEFGDETAPVRLRLGETAIGPNGNFRNQNVRLEGDDRTVTHTDGSWGGQFSNIPVQTGEPRLVAGTAGAEWTEADGSVGVFVGAWFGTRN